MKSAAADVLHVFLPEAEILPSRRSETRTPLRPCPAPYPGSAHRGVEEHHAGAPGWLVADGALDSQQSQFSGLEHEPVAKSLSLKSDKTEPLWWISVNPDSTMLLSSVR